MFRRPMRPLRRAVQSAFVHPNRVLLRAVTQANQMLANGKPGKAAQIYERLAREAEQRSLVKPAANAHAQAALAYASVKNESAASKHARAALNQFAQLNLGQRAAIFFNNITQHLRENGFASAAGYNQLLRLHNTVVYQASVHIVPVLRAVTMSNGSMSIARNVSTAAA